MYYVLLFFLYPFSLLPFSVLYRISDVTFFLIYHVMGYRKEVVWDNMRNAFPDKTEEEISAIRKAFYKNFCDQWIETLKLLSISEKALKKRCTGNWEVFRSLGAEGRNTYAMLGHTFNWEWANVVCQYNVPQQFAGVYLPLTNKGFDRLMYHIRSRSGGWLVSMKALKSGLSRLKDKQYILALIADQNPAVTEVADWMSFMHREAPFFRGGEQMARRAKAAVVFAGIKKIKRGYYQIHLDRICTDASQTEAGHILHQYVRFMERQLQEQPENWLWSHRRWKHTRQSG